MPCALPTDAGARQLLVEARRLHFRLRLCLTGGAMGWARAMCKGRAVCSTRGFSRQALIWLQHAPHRLCQGRFTALCAVKRKMRSINNACGVRQGPWTASARCRRRRRRRRHAWCGSCALMGNLEGTWGYIERCIAPSKQIMQEDVRVDASVHGSRCPCTTLRRQPLSC